MPVRPTTAPHRVSSRQDDIIISEESLTYDLLKKRTYKADHPTEGNSSVVPLVSLREKAELRSIVEKDERFAVLLEETTNQAIVAVKQNPNIFLRTQAEFMWKTLLLMWDMENGLDHVPRMHVKQRIDHLENENALFRSDLEDCRRCYLKEVVATRDRIRQLEEEHVGLISDLVYGTEQPVMFYDPVKYLPEDLQNFVAEVVEEKLKLLLFRLQGDDDGGDGPGGRRASLRRRSIYGDDDEAEKKIAELQAELASMAKRNVELERLSRAYGEELEKIASGMNNFAKQAKNNEDVVAKVPELNRIHQDMSNKRVSISRSMATKAALVKRLESREARLNEQQKELDELRAKNASAAELKAAAAAVQQLEKEVGPIRSEITTANTQAMQWQEELTELEKDFEERKSIEEEKQKVQEEASEKASESPTSKHSTGMDSPTDPIPGASQNSVEGGGSWSNMARQASGASAGGDDLKAAAKSLGMSSAPGSVGKAHKVKMMMLRAVMSSAHQSKKQAEQALKELQCQYDALQERMELLEEESDENLKIKLDLERANMRLKDRISELEDDVASKSNSKMSEADLTRMKSGLEDELRKAFEEEMEKMRGELAHAKEKIEGLEKDKKKLRQSEERIAELEALVEKKDATIKKLRAEIERLETALQELQAQIQALLTDKKSGSKGFEAGKKKLGEALNWVVKSSHRNVFERLYHDAVDRIQRMEQLRQTFLVLQRSQLYDLITEEAESGRLEGSLETKGHQAYHVFLAQELQKMKKDNLPEHNRWGNPMTDPDLLNKARENLDGLYPPGGNLSTGAGIRPDNSLMRQASFPIHNNFQPAVANFGKLDFGREPPRASNLHANASNSLSGTAPGTSRPNSRGTNYSYQRAHERAMGSNKHILDQQVLEPGPRSKSPKSPNTKSPRSQQQLGSGIGTQKTSTRPSTAGGNYTMSACSTSRPPSAAHQSGAARRNIRKNIAERSNKDNRSDNLNMTRDSGHSLGETIGNYSGRETEFPFSNFPGDVRPITLGGVNASGLPLSSSSGTPSEFPGTQPQSKYPSNPTSGAQTREHSARPHRPPKGAQNVAHIHSLLPFSETHASSNFEQKLKEMNMSPPRPQSSPDKRDQGSPGLRAGRDRVSLTNLINVTGQQGRDVDQLHIGVPDPWSYSPDGRVTGQHMLYSSLQAIQATHHVTQQRAIQSQRRPVSAAVSLPDVKQERVLMPITTNAPLHKQPEKKV